MAVDMFLKIEGVDGESIDSKHSKEIDIDAWSWGMSQAGTTHVAQGGGAGKVSVNDITISKFIDRASPNLLKACCTGKHFKEATITVRKAGDKPLEYVTIKMKDVIVSNVNIGGSGGAERLTEAVTLNFAEYEFSYVPQKSDGGADAAIRVGYNMAKNTEV
ncbi:MAG: type VI secretion system tube protein Hcp [Limnobacter sp.]|nr:type VI secretion system tube protein Hcp [Limnobacter sp.]